MLRLHDRNCKLQRQLHFDAGTKLKYVAHIPSIGQFVIATASPSLLFVDDSADGHITTQHVKKKGKEAKQTQYVTSLCVLVLLCSL